VVRRGGYVEDDPMSDSITSPMMSGPVEATASACIPVEELENIIPLMNGYLKDSSEYKYKWESITLRNVFGPQVGELLDRVDQFAEQLAGYVQTSSDAINNYLDFLANKIKNYIKIIEIITDIVLTLLNFRLRGSLLVLKLSPETGGIRNFADRVRKSEVDSYTLSALANETTESAAALASIRGGYFSAIWIVGYPDDPTDPSTWDEYTQPYMEEYNETANKLEDSNKTLNLLLKILVGG
jgi:hypothetical protein